MAMGDEAPAEVRRLSYETLTSDLLVSAKSMSLDPCRTTPSSVCDLSEFGRALAREEGLG